MFQKRNPCGKSLHRRSHIVQETLWRPPHRWPHVPGALGFTMEVPQQKEEKHQPSLTSSF